MAIKVIADDGGAIPAIDDAIDALVNLNVLHGVAAFATFDQLERCRSWREKGADVGIHLNLSTGSPVDDPANIPSLVDQSGCFWDPRDQPGRDPKEMVVSYMNAQTSRLVPSEVAREFTAQVERFTSVLGFEPDFVSVHHDLDLIDSVRTAADAAQPGKLCRQTRRQRGLLNLYEYALHPSGVTVATVSAYLCGVLSRAKDVAAAEVICHPALEMEELDSITVYAEQRATEYLALQSSVVRVAIEDAQSGSMS